MQKQIKKPQHQNNYNQLFSNAKHIEEKIDLGISNDLDFHSLKTLSVDFLKLGSIKESLFCRKLLIKHSLNNSNSDLNAINQIHDWAVDLVIEAEAHKIFQASFYKTLIKVKSILSGLLTQHSYEQLAIANSGKAYLQKAKKLFPTYEKLNNYNFL